MSHNNINITRTADPTLRHAKSDGSSITLGRADNDDDNDKIT